MGEAVEYIRYFVELGAVLMGVIACPFIIVVLLRGYRIPECYSCGAMKVRPSRVVGFWDVLGNAFLVRPFRCSGCRERFHAFVLLGGARERSEVQPVQLRRVIHVLVRFRNGLPNRLVIRVVYLGRGAANRNPSAMPVSSGILHTYTS